MSNLYRIPSTEKRKVAMNILIMADSEEEAIEKYNNDDIKELDDIEILESWDRVDTPSEIEFLGFIEGIE